MPWYRVLEQPGIRIGRTDPKLDPKGRLTVTLMKQAASYYKLPRLDRRTLGAPENPAQVLPEETMIGRLQSGQLDVGFFYSTETSEAKIPAVHLPAAITPKAVYTVTVLHGAPNPQGAEQFVEFLLGQKGRTLMQENGLAVRKPELTGNAAAVPHAIRAMLTQSQVTQRAATPLPWLAGLLAAYLIAPLLAGAVQVGFANWHSVDTGALLHATAVSIASASVSTLVIAIGGIPLGYLLARSRGRAMGWLGFVVQLPLALPPLSSGILLLFLVGYTTPLGRLAQGWLTNSFTGIVLAEVFVAAPFLIIAARSGFAAVDPVLEGVAATLGRRPLDVFLHVSLPIAWPAILSGLLLAWLRAFGEFGATVMVAYHPYSLPVYTYVAFGSQGLPAMLPMLLPTLLVALAIMGLSGLVTDSASRTGPASRRAMTGRCHVPLRGQATVPRRPATLRLEMENSSGGSVCRRAGRPTRAGWRSWARPGRASH